MDADDRGPCSLTPERIRLITRIIRRGRATVRTSGDY